MAFSTQRSAGGWPEWGERAPLPPPPPSVGSQWMVDMDRGSPIHQQAVGTKRDRGREEETSAAVSGGASLQDPPGRCTPVESRDHKRPRLEGGGDVETSSTGDIGGAGGDSLAGEGESGSERGTRKTETSTDDNARELRHVRMLPLSCVKHLHCIA